MAQGQRSIVFGSPTEGNVLAMAEKAKVSFSAMVKTLVEEAIKSRQKKKK